MFLITNNIIFFIYLSVVFIINTLQLWFSSHKYIYIHICTGIMWMCTRLLTINNTPINIYQCIRWRFSFTIITSWNKRVTVGIQKKLQFIYLFSCSEPFDLRHQCNPLNIERMTKIRHIIDVIQKRELVLEFLGI